MDLTNIFKAIGQETPAWMREETLNLANHQWIAFFLLVVVGFVIKRSSSLFIAYAKSFTDKTKTKSDDKFLFAVREPLGGILATTFWLVSLQAFELNETTMTVFQKLLQAVLSIYLIYLAYRLCDVITYFLQTLSEKTETDFDDHLIPLIAKILKVFVLSFGVLVALQNLGINVMSLLAGLGLGGLAFALAAKDTAANFFGSVMIFIDRPFRVGDWIVTNQAEGTVEEIGFRSTRIRTFYNSQISVPNSVVVNENIDNMGRREFRRVYTRLGITYSSSPEQVESFRTEIRKIIAEHPNTRKDMYHVYFNEYGASSLEIMVYFFLKVPDWGTELKDREEIFLEIMKAAKRVGVSFAFPSQSLYFETPLKILENASNPSPN